MVLLTPYRALLVEDLLRDQQLRRRISARWSFPHWFAMPRASWRGFLRLSLVTCPVYLSPATTGTKPIRLHQVWQPAPVEVNEDTLPGSECRAAGFGIIGTAACRRPYQP